MKKHMYLLGTLILVFYSCFLTSSQLYKENQSESLNLNYLENFNEEQEELEDINYKTIDDLLKGISNEFTETKLNDIEKMEDQEIKGNFRKFIGNRINQKSIHIPYFNDKPIELRNKKGFSNITIAPSGYLNMPGLWFYSRINNSNSYILIRYLSGIYDDDFIKEANEKGIVWFLKQVDPSVIDSDNSKSNSIYKDMYEKDIVLKNKIVKAKIQEIKNESTVYFAFIYDDLFINICATFSSATPEWFENLDFKKVILEK